MASQAIEQFLNESVTQTALGKGEGLAASFADLAERLNLSGPARQMAEMMFNKYQGQLDMEESVEMLKALAMHSQADVYTELNPVDPAEVKGILKDPNHYRSKSPITITRLNDFEDYQRRRGVVAKTVDTQLSRLKKLKAWLEDNQKELRHESIEVYLDTLDCANKTKKQHLFAGNSFWKWAIKKDKTFKQQHQEKANPFENQHLEEVRGVRKKERKAFTVMNRPVFCGGSLV